MKINITKFTTATIVLAPWLGNYRFFISGLSFGDFLLIVAILLNLITSIKHKKIISKNHIKTYRILMMYFAYAVAGVLFLIMIGEIIDYSLSIKRVIKMGLYFLVILYLLPKRINYSYFVRIYKIIVYISCAAIIIQNLAYYSIGKYIVFKLPFLPFNSEAAESFNYVESRLFSFRPDSIFLEPSHFVYYVIGYIIICLFPVEDRSPKVIEASIISVCVLMSISSSSIFFLSLIWLYFLITLIKNKEIKINSKIKIFFSVITIIGCVIFIYISTDLYESFDRLQTTSSGNSANSVWGKVAVGDLYTNSLEGFQKLFGNGLGNYNTPVFSTTVNFVYYCTGYIGIFILTYWAFKSYLFSNHAGRLIILCTVMLFFAWYLIYSPVFILYNVIIIHGLNAKKRQDK